MNKEFYIKELEGKEISNNGKEILIKQINNYYNVKKQKIVASSKYNIGDRVSLKKGTLLHGTYKNIDGLKEIVKDGLISSWFIDGRMSKYPSSVGLWNLKKDYYLDEYINFYSGGINFHSRREYAVIEWMIKGVEIVSLLINKQKDN